MVVSSKESLKEELKKYIEKSVFVHKNKHPEMFEFNGADWVFDFKSAFFNTRNATIIAELFWSAIREKNPSQLSFAIGGMESGAIPLVSALVLNAPEGITVTGFYVRKSKKKTNLMKRYEGEISQGACVVIVDDILNKGLSFAKIVKILELDDIRISYFFSVIRFRDLSFYSAEKLFTSEPITLFSLDDFSESLGLKNMREKETSAQLSKKFTYCYGVTLSKHNPRHVLSKSSPLYHEGNIYFGTDEGVFFCVNAEDGSVIWSHLVLFGSYDKKIFSSPCVYQDTILFGAYDGNLYALDAITGKKKWVFFDADWIGSSPCVNEKKGVVYIGLEFGLFQKKGGVVAIDIASGVKKWSFYDMDGLTHASPNFSSHYNMVVCGGSDSFVYAFDADTGELLWKVLVGGEIKQGAVFYEKNNTVWVGALDGNMYGIDVKKGNIVSTFSALAGFYSTPVIYKNIMIVGSLDKYIYAWDLNTGNLVWEIETQGRIFSSPSIHNNFVYIGSNDGGLRVIDPMTGKVAGIIIFADRIVTKVATHEDKVYVLTDACQLFAYKEESY